MRVVEGLESARRVLVAGRRLKLDSVPPHVQKKTEEVFGAPLSPLQAVQLILKRVREGGDDAVRDLTRRLDGVDQEAFEVPASDVKSAQGSVPQELVEALELAAGRIRRFHEASMPQGWMDHAEGYGEILTPVERVGVCVPGRSGRFPSTLLMAAIPARVAGVREIVVCTPSGEGGTLHPSVLLAAGLAGVDRVFQIGGAQAVAAMAYGTETVPRVDMVCGPGNVFVTLAKKLLYGEVGIDGLYGPTETMIIADDSANPTLCAADLVAQAEHDYLATPVLVTTSRRVAEAVEVEAGDRAAGIDRSAEATAALDRQGCVAIVSDLDEALKLANEFAPEHLSLMVREPRRHLVRVRNAGVVFLGEFSHEVLGDYVAGPSHVMPTGGTARFGSGIGVRTFLKSTPVVALDDATSAALTEAASLIGRAEGFTGHAEAAEIRDELRG